jgi:hypothetical protein
MANWVSILRTVAPDLARIVSAAAPAFTARAGMVNQQIAELQQAALNNAASIKELAGEGQKMAKALEELVAANVALTTANQAAAEQLRQARQLAIAAIVIAIVAVLAAVVVAVVR